MSSIEHLRRDLHFVLEMTKAGIRMRNEGSYLGFVWYLLEPMIMFCILLYVFSRFMGDRIEHYSLYLLVGIVMWHFFLFGTSRSIRCIATNINLIKSLNVRKDLIVLSSVLVAFVSHICELIVVAAFMCWYHVFPSHILSFVALEIVLFVWIFGLGLLLSSLFVVIRDMANVWMFVQRAWWFVTPVFYVLPENEHGLRSVNVWNPMFHFLQEARNVLIYSTKMNLYVFGGLCAISILMLCIGYSVFQKLSPRFAEII